MSKHVFILGAGFSRQAGAPLMNDFLERAEMLFRRDKGGGTYERVFKVLSELQRVHSKSALDLYNIESVFGAFEMGRTLGRLPGCGSPTEVDQLIPALNGMICETLKSSIRFPYADERLGPRSGYHTFADAIRRLNDSAHDSSRSTVITFNYDLIAEEALLAQGVGYDYCVGDMTSDIGDPSPGATPILKLHGSINWGKCRECETIVANYLKEPSRVLEPDDHYSYLRDGSEFAAGALHCGQPVDPPPFLVPPSWNKLDYARPLAPVWKRAAEELSTAENIFVVGYSLPETDSFFRHLYALGSVGDRFLKRFWVFDIDPHGGVVESRFRAVLGPAALTRFKYSSQGFNGFLNELAIFISGVQ